MTTEELSCKELVAIVTEYLDGSMSPQDRARFDAHLVVCEGCQTYLDQMRRTIHLLGRTSATEAMVPSEAMKKLLDVFRDWKKG